MITNITITGCSPAAQPEMPVQEPTAPLQCAAELSGEIETIHTPKTCQSTGCFPTGFNPVSKPSTQS